MNVEMPQTCRQGEQIGIRITIFNYMMRDIEVMVVLANSPYYKFIHVDAFGSVQSYNPRTSTGEHQHLVWIRAQDAVQVHMPIVPTVLGDVSVSIRVVAQIAQDHVTRTIHVEVKTCILK
jgi:CD109 antigen